jgi:U3 small nucleolar ribonucleoprotein protein IMP3
VLKSELPLENPLIDCSTTSTSGWGEGCAVLSNVPIAAEPSLVLVTHSMRQLKFHEYRLLKKTDFLQWKRENSQREVKVVRRYRLSDPEDYHKYSKIVGEVRHLAHLLQHLPQDDEVRIQRTEDLLTKLFDMGLIQVKNGLDSCAKVTVSALCRRRLPVVLVRLHFAENLKEAVTLIEQGHVRIGPAVVKDQALLVTRSMQDFITWVDSSRIKRKVAKYNDQLDDFDLLNA